MPSKRRRIVASRSSSAQGHADFGEQELMNAVTRSAQGATRNHLLARRASRKAYRRVVASDAPVGPDELDVTLSVEYRNSPSTFVAATARAMHFCAQLGSRYEMSAKRDDAPIGDRRGVARRRYHARVARSYRRGRRATAHR
jgi:hypothetical protein